jgi:16S rRNA (cytosine1402-N4)-methyltransferase
VTHDSAGNAAAEDSSRHAHGHQPVLLGSVIDLTVPKRGGCVIDATAGRGGHASALAAAVDPGVVILLDRDAGNLQHALERTRTAAPHSRIEGVHADFRSVATVADRLGVRADILIADLGVSSNQIDTPDRGFSFHDDGPLDMRLDRSLPVTAADLVRDLSESDIASLIATLGEDPFSRAIARKIAQSRITQPITTTAHLARLVREAYGSRARFSRLHPATRTFMALRIAVNDELRALEELLGSITSAAEARGAGWLSDEARVAVISFHSLEDRQVKRSFAALVDAALAHRLTRRPEVANDTEVAANPRARSAKLRAIALGTRKSLP